MAKRHQGNTWFLLLFVVLGYLGTANFYSYLIGLNTATRFLCPLCPDIDNSGNALPKFIWRVAVLGSFNALLFLAAGWFLMFLIRIVRRNSAID